MLKDHRVTDVGSERTAEEGKLEPGRAEQRE